MPCGGAAYRPGAQRADQGAHHAYRPTGGRCAAAPCPGPMAVVGAAAPEWEGMRIQSANYLPDAGDYRDGAHDSRNH